MSYVRSSHLIEAAATDSFDKSQTLQPTETYTDVVPIVQVLREITAGGFALILTTPFLHIYELWLTCLNTNSVAPNNYVFIDYEGIVGGAGVFVDTAVYVGQTLVLTDILTPTEGAAPFCMVTVPGINDTATIVYSIVGTTVL